MGARLQDLLPHDAGIRLPEPVHQALTELGAACNEATVAVNHAFAFVLQATNNRTVVASRPAAQLRTTVACDLERVADRFYEQTLVVLARAATTYAVYASRVAAAIAAGDTPPAPAAETLKPSDLIAALGLYLPPVRFGDVEGDASVADEQNALVEAEYQALTKVITGQLEGHNAAAYDNLPAVAVGAVDLEISPVFPEALHDYAATLTWAIGLLAGVRDEGDHGPDGVA
jgi:hypothetical protein